MATVEGKPPMQTSLQRMLELEKKYKLERLQGQQLPPASTTAPGSYNNRPPLTARRSDSLAHYQQNYLMLKAVRRSVALPSLSITIPPDGGDQKRGTSTERAANKENRLHKEAVVEPLHKQVKFLPPDDDDLSDQSSICQSPSWEGYGMKKREKKKEAERKKKEKEQQGKEIKAAKRRLAARLSKAPPRPTASPLPVPFANTERAMSDTQLISRRLRTGPFSKSLADIEQGHSRSGQEVQDTEAAALAEDKNVQFIGELKLEQERQLALNGVISQHALAMASSVPKGRQQMQKSYSSPGTTVPPVPPIPTSKEAKQTQDVHPPSASRTPLLRQASATAHSRSNSLLSGASKMFHRRERSRSGQRAADVKNSQESLHTPSSGAERGRLDNSYVQHQRDLSKERAMAGLADDQHVGNANSQTSAARSNPRQGLSRRSSLTIEARSVAAKFSVLKSTSGLKGSAKAHHARSQSSTDYFTFLEQPYSPPAVELLSPRGSLPASMRDKPSPQDSPSAQELLSTAEVCEQSEEHDELRRPATRPNDSWSNQSRQFLFPTTSMQPIILSDSSSKTPSIASSGSAPSKKGRSFRDVFSAFSMHHTSMPPTPLESPAPPKSSPPQLRTRMSPYSHGISNASQITSAPPALSPPFATLQLPAKAARILGEYNELTAASGQSGSSDNPPIKPTTIQTHSGSRVSEGSSSSSAYDDASPLPSPATTPDTSRPQSSKGLPAAGDPSLNGGGDSDTVQDDKTIREVSDSSGKSTRTGTPRLEVSQPREKKSMTEEEQWSRTALPLDLDFDAQSFVTSFSNLDNIDNIDDELARARLMTTSPRAEILAAQAAKVKANTKRSQEHLHVPEESRGSSKVLLNPDLRNTSEGAADVGLVFGANNEVTIPPRSKRREQAAERPSTAAMDSHLQESKQDAKHKKWELPELKTFKEFQAQEQERGPKSRRQDVKLERTREVAKRDMRHGRTSEMPDAAQDESHKPKRQHKKEQLRDVAREDESKKLQDKEQSHASAEVTKYLATDLKRTATSKPEDDSSSSIYSSHSIGSSNQTSAPGPASSPEASSSPRSGSPSPSVVLPAPVQAMHEATPQLRSAPVSQPAQQASKPPSSVSAPATPAASPNSRSVGNGLVSILKQTSRSQSPPPSSHRGSMLSAIPKHMQMQAGMSSRPPVAVADQRVAPIAKMFVECCSCKFYHDMPSKLYECMAKPDAVVEDRLLGISGAITTMVKCPWCTHNMTTQCCAGYAAVVYLKERLH